MGFQIRSLAGLLLLTAALAMMPINLSADGLGYQDAAAAAGGNGKGKGQGAAHAGANGNNASQASAGANTHGKDKTYLANEAGIFNGPLNASASAWVHASPNSRIGTLAGAYTTALNSFLTNTVAPDQNAVDVVTIEQLAGILATIANKDTVTADVIEALHEKIVSVGLVDQTLLDQASAQLAPLSLDPTTPTPTFAEQVADQTNLILATQNEGIGQPGTIY